MFCFVRIREREKEGPGRKKRKEEGRRRKKKVARRRSKEGEGGVSFSSEEKESFSSFFFLLLFRLRLPRPLSLSLQSKFPLSPSLSYLRVQARQGSHGAVVDDDQRLRGAGLPRDGRDALGQAAPLCVGARERRDDDDKDLPVLGGRTEALGHGVGGDPRWRWRRGGKTCVRGWREKRSRLTAVSPEKKKGKKGKNKQQQDGLLMYFAARTNVFPGAVLSALTATAARHHASSSEGA